MSNLFSHNLFSRNLLTHNLSTHSDIDTLRGRRAHTHNVITQLVLTQLVNTSTGSRGRRGVSRGRHGTRWHRSSLCVAGVALTALGGLQLAHAQRAHTHTLVLTQLVLTQLVLTQLVNTSTCVAGVALGDIHLRFAWQTCPHTPCHHTMSSHNLSSHNLSSHNLSTHPPAHTQLALRLRFRRGTYGTGRALVAQRVPVVAAASRVAGVALGNIHLRFAWHFANVAISWQEWQPVVLFCSARYRLHRADAVPLTCPFCSYVWCFSPHLCVGFLCGRGGRHGCWCGRRGSLRHPPFFHVAGVVLGDVHTYVCITFPAQLFLLLDPCHHLLCLSFLPSPSQLLHAHTHTRTHTHTHTCTHTHTSHTTYHHTTYHHTTYSHLLFHTQLTPHQSFTISFLFLALPMPSLRFFCCLLEEVDMWGCPVP